MKGLTYTLKIIVFVLNAIFLTGLIFFLIRLGARPRNLYDWAGFISMFAFPPITLITVALTFRENFRILVSFLRIIAVILNASFLLLLIYFTAIGQVSLEGFIFWMLGLLGYGLPVINILTLTLILRRAKETSIELR